MHLTKSNLRDIRVSNILKESVPPLDKFLKPFVVVKKLLLSVTALNKKVKFNIHIRLSLCEKATFVQISVKTTFLFFLACYLL